MRTIWLILMLCAQALALSVPSKSTYDPRIQIQRYNALDVTKIQSAIGISTLVSFADDEAILHVATGFADGWDITIENNLIFLKPIAIVAGEIPIEPTEEWNTNLLVKTTKRLYAFDLVFVEQAKPTYILNFSYPEDSQKRAIAKENADIQRALKKSTLPRNWQYTMKVPEGSREIAPDFAYDDGNFTYLGFSKNKEFPSVFLHAGKNKESIVNHHVRYEKNYHVLVVQKVAKNFVLRSGEKVVGVFNEDFNRDSKEPIRNTQSHQVQRRVAE